MRSLIITFCLFTAFIGSSQETDSSFIKPLNPSPVLFFGMSYYLPKAADSLNVVVEGHGLYIEEEKDRYRIRFKGSFDNDQAVREEHYLLYKQVSGTDTTVIYRQNFEGMNMPRPVFEWDGSRYSSSETWLVHKDSLDILNSLAVVPSDWYTGTELSWKVDAWITVGDSGQTYSLDGLTIGEEALNEIKKTTGPTNLIVSGKYKGMGYAGNMKIERMIEILSNEQFLKANDPWYVFDSIHAGKNVLRIGTWFVQEAESGTIENNNDLFLFFWGQGSQNTFIVKSLDSGETITYQTYPKTIEEMILIDFRDKFGTFKISFWGDDGRGEMDVNIIKKGK